MDIPGNDQEVCPLSSSSGGEETRQINPGEFGSPTYQPPGPIQIERESPKEEEKWEFPDPESPRSHVDLASF